MPPPRQEPSDAALLRASFDQNRQKSEKLKKEKRGVFESDRLHQQTELEKLKEQQDAKRVVETQTRKQALRHVHTAAKRAADEDRRQEQARLREDRQRHKTDWQGMKHETDKEAKERQVAARARAEQQKLNRENRNQSSAASIGSSSAMAGHSSLRRTPSPPRRARSLKELRAAPAYGDAADDPRERPKRGAHSCRAPRSRKRKLANPRAGHSPEREEWQPHAPRTQASEQEWLKRYQAGVGRLVMEDMQDDFRTGVLGSAGPPAAEVAWKLRCDARKPHPKLPPLVRSASTLPRLKEPVMPRGVLCRRPVC